MWDHPVLTVSCLLAALPFVCIVWLLFPRGHRNPFARDARRPPNPVVRDGATRDRVLKQGYVKKRVPQNLDAIIIGSGASGLVSAAILSRAGLRVLVLEQHDVAGGSCHTFSEKGFEFDVGIHYVGEMGPGSDLQALLEVLTSGQFQWTKLDQQFDTAIIKGKSYPVKHGHEEWRKILLEKFPKEADAVNKYIDLVKDIGQKAWPLVVVKMLDGWIGQLMVKSGLIGLLSPIFQYAGRSLQDVTEELTGNEELRVVMQYIFGTYGVSPSQSSFFLHAIVQHHFLQQGGFYPLGGSSEIAFHLIPTIQEAGGAVLVRAPVTEIIINENKKACGVKVLKSGEEDEIFAPIIISSVGIHNTFRKLLPKEIAHQSEYLQKIKYLLDKPATAGISVFVGLSGSSDELSLPQHNHWIFEDVQIDRLFQDYLSKSAAEAKVSSVPFLFASFPSAKDPEWKSKHPDKSMCTLITFVNYEWFEKWKDERVKHRGKEYEDLKSAVGQQIWKQFCKLYPQLNDKVEYFEVGSPLSNNYYLGFNHGEIYGMDHCMGRFTPDGLLNLRSDTDISGLYMTGQDLVTAGLSGALLSAILCTTKVLKRYVFVDLLLMRLRFWWNEKFSGLHKKRI